MRGAACSALVDAMRIRANRAAGDLPLNRRAAGLEARVFCFCSQPQVLCDGPMQRHGQAARIHDQLFGVGVQVRLPCPVVLVAGLVPKVMLSHLAFARDQGLLTVKADAPTRKTAGDIRHV